MVKAPAWDALLERGKAEEKRGRLAEAERAYRAALRANPDFASLEREFARFLESRGRFAQAEPHLRRALERGWPREEGEAALARLRGKASLPALIEAGRFLEAAAALEAGAGADGAEAVWPEVFSALLCAGRYGEAFRLGEAMLERSARTPLANSFLWPWWREVNSRGSAKKMRFCARELARLDAARGGGDFPGWFAYCRGVLLLGLGRDREALAEHARIRRLRAPRYALLHHPFVMHLLLAGRFERTVALCRALLAGAPDYWWFQCRMAEALMAGGDVPGGLREFARAAAGASGERARRAVTVWHGAALLWAGRYRAALKKLDEGEALGAKIWVNCWRGAARLKLGDARGALSDLDAAIAADPEDLEAYLWRGEAHRLAGRPAKALRDLDRALALDPKYAWACVNRALARGDAGDAEGMAVDYARLPKDFVAALGGPQRGVPDRARMRALLESGLARAKGIRRPEAYLNSIWLGSRG